MTNTNQFLPTPLSVEQLQGAIDCEVSSEASSKNADGIERVVLVLAFNGVTLLDVVSPVEVFDLSMKYVLNDLKRPYRTIVASISGDAIRSSSGLQLETSKLSDLQELTFDTVIVPGGGPPSAPPVPDDLVEWLKLNAHRADRLCSVCTGGFILAAAGLATNRKLTTHWEAAALLHADFPDIDVDYDSIYVRDGPIWSTAGFTAGIDMVLAMIEEDHGYYTAIQVAKRLVVFLKRSEGQSQFSLPLETQTRSDRKFAKLHAWISNHLTDDLSVTELAAQTNMSPRNFARRYKNEVGCTSTQTVTLLRVEAASLELRTSQVPIKKIALSSGFGNELNLRRAIKRTMGVSPEAYRQRFSKAQA